VFNHNHPIDAVEVLRRRDVGVDVQTKFNKLFESGYSPRSAMEMHKFDLQLEHGEDFTDKVADRRYCPDMQWCFRKYYQLFKADGNQVSENSMFKTLQQRVEKFNLEFGEKSIVCNMLDDSVVVALCTPIMKRVHRTVHEASYVVFVDSLSCAESSSCHVYLMMTNCEAGGLPLGVIISSSSAENVLTDGFEMLKSLLPSDAFCGRAEQGPLYFITDDSISERNAIASVFPQSLALLCQYHVQWATWRWLWGEQSEIEVQSRNYLYRLVETAVLANTYEALAEAFTTIHYDAIANEHSDFIAYIDQLLEKSTLWASCYRQDDVIQSLNTNNTIDRSVRIVKDKLFKRLKAFNIVHLVDFVMNKMEQYYFRRLVGVANCRQEKPLRHSRIFPKDQRIVLENVWKIMPDVVMVPCDTPSTCDTAYYVNTSAWICSCPEGHNGAPCSHQWAASTKYRTHLRPVSDPIIASSHLQKLLLYISSGIEDLPSELFLEMAASQNDNIPLPMEDESEDNDQMLLNMNSSQEDSKPVTRLEQAESKLQAFTTSLSDKMKLFPSAYLPAVESFLTGYDRLSSRTNAEILSALHCFGKYSGTIRGSPAGHKRKADHFL